MKLLYTTGGDTMEIAVEENSCEPELWDDANPDSVDKGHLYIIEGAFTLGDLATLVRLLQKREAPSISAVDMAQLSRLNNILEEGSLED